LASKVVKMLDGTLRRGSGITGSGGACGVVPVTDGPRCAASAEYGGPLRALGADLGTGMLCGGTGAVCAANGMASKATEAAINSRARTEGPRDADSAD
jgi:hypothetical protein